MKENLVDKNEKLLFTVLMVLGVLAWVGLIIGTFGGALLFILFGFIFYIFIQSGFIAYLQGSGAIITQEQFPDLYAMHMECCDKLEVKKPPTLIMIHADGMFNALATRFFKKHYVILFSDIVDALKDEPEATKFYIGHELGHVKRNHLFWDPFMMLVSWLPLIGAGYSRAREITCDNHGRYCCNSDQAAVKAMSALVVGADRWKTMNVDALMKQNDLTKKFWMSFHEVISNYPWLIRRIAMIKDGDAKSLPRRHPMAWVLGIFVPKFSIMSLVILYVLIVGFSAMHSIKEAQGLSDNAYSYEEYSDEYGEYDFAPEVEPESSAVPYDYNFDD